MPALTAISAALASTAGTALATGATLVGTAASVAGQVISSNASAEAESIRKKQMLQEQARRQREIFRQSQLARATALSNAGQSGTLDSSGIQGAIGQIVTQTGQQTTALTENTENSVGIFNANADAAFGQGLASTGKGLSNLGSTIISLQPQMEKIGQQGLFGTPTNSLYSTTNAAQVKF